MASCCSNHPRYEREALAIVGYRACPAATYWARWSRLNRQMSVCYFKPRRLRVSPLCRLNCRLRRGPGAIRHSLFKAPPSQRPSRPGPCPVQPRWRPALHRPCTGLAPALPRIAPGRQSLPKSIGRPFRHRADQKPLGVQPQHENTSRSLARGEVTHFGNDSFPKCVTPPGVRMSRSARFFRRSVF